jgi:uncharacterized protein (TIGR02145 family)
LDFYGGVPDVGGKLKVVSPLWQSPNFGATNESGFSALPGGNYAGSLTGNNGFIGFFWTPNGNQAFAALLSHNSASILRAGHNPTQGYSVRCVKD